MSASSRSAGDWPGLRRGSVNGRPVVGEYRESRQSPGWHGAVRVPDLRLAGFPHPRSSLTMTSSDTVRRGHCCAYHLHPWRAGGLRSLGAIPEGADQETPTATFTLEHSHELIFQNWLERRAAWVKTQRQVSGERACAGGRRPGVGHPDRVRFRTLDYCFNAAVQFSTICSEVVVAALSPSRSVFNRNR